MTMLEVHKTMVNGDHKLGRNEYVLGRIMGMEYVICGYGDVVWQPRISKIPLANHTIITSICTPDQYETFKSMVEKQYPGLCVFMGKWDEFQNI